MPEMIIATLKGLTNASDVSPQIKKADLSPGDWVVITTVKSVYRLRALADGRFEVSGGWFDKKGLSPMRLSVSGCTWGGSAIMTRVVAACGLRIEFGNRLTTSPVQRIVVVPAAVLN